MSFAWVRALYMSGVLLITTYRASGFSGPMGPIPSAAKLTSEPLRGLMRTLVAAQDEEERMPLSTPLKSVTINGVQHVLSINVVHLEEALMMLRGSSIEFHPGQSTSFENVNTVRTEESNIDPRVLLLVDEMLRFAPVMFAFNRQRRQHLRVRLIQKLNQVNAAIAVHLAHDFPALQSTVGIIEKEQFAKFFEKNKDPNKLRELWLSPENRPAGAHIETYVKAIIAKYSKFYKEKMASLEKND